MRLYHYVGPKRIADRIRPEQTGMPVCSPADVQAWVRNTDQKLSGGSVIATFVVNAAGVLLIADRRSEHVACAGGLSVRAAGEITFVVGSTVEVADVSNQSTGYCPEPASLPAVADALKESGFAPPTGFTLVCEFRRCLECGNLTLIKDGVMECGVCGAELPDAYNCQPPES